VTHTRVRFVGKGPTVAVRVCETEAERRTGLQGSPPLGAEEGMLLAYTPAQAASVHMGSVGFPLDFVFVRRGRVQRVVSAAPGRGSWGHPYVDTVLEVPGGFCRTHGIVPGDELVMATSDREAEHRIAAQRTAGGTPVLCSACPTGRLTYDDGRDGWVCVSCGWAGEPGMRLRFNPEREGLVLATLTSVDPLRSLTEAERAPLPGQGLTDRPGGDISPAATPGTPGAGLDQAAPHWDQEQGYDVSVADVLDGRVPAIRPAALHRLAGEIHPGDRVVVLDRVDGLDQDAEGVCEEVQGNAIKVKLDGEPVPRWITNDLLRQDTPKDEVLEGDDEGESVGGLLGGG
jgi:uncharacterized membrane protein (UPF0127 family)